MKHLSKPVIGIDLGGTKIEAALISFPKVIRKIKIPTEAGLGNQHVIEKIKAVIDVLWTSQVSAIGIGVPGAVTNAHAIMSLPHIPGWNHVELEKIIKKHCNLPVYVDNDVNCFALAEFSLGYPSVNNLVGITLGTGIGGGLIINKKLYRGSFGFAGEIGDMVLGGKKWEDYCSGVAIEKRYQNITKQKKTAMEISGLSRKKDRTAIKIIAKAGEYLGWGLASIINILNPDVIVIGGGASRIHSYVACGKRAMKKYCYPVINKNTAVNRARFVSSGVIGAAILCQKS